MKFKLRNTDGRNLKTDYLEVVNKYNVKVLREEDFYGCEYEVTIGSLKTLMEFVRDVGQPIIITDDSDGRNIEIYDNWRE